VAKVSAVAAAPTAVNVQFFLLLVFSTFYGVLFAVVVPALAGFYIMANIPYFNVMYTGSCIPAVGVP
jgi:hypothetical protein